MKAIIKMNKSSDAMIEGAAGTMLDGIEAEPVPSEIMDLALLLQSKFAERNAPAQDKTDEPATSAD